jgi:hypothetical protein
LWWWSTLGAGTAAYGLFHAVSAFNNAGFALWSGSLMSWRGDVVVNLVITVLIIAGGLGFFVWAELLSRHRRTVKISVHTRLVLAATAALLVGGTVMLLALEWNNPRTLATLPFGDKVLAAWFQSVTTRTAGFNTLDIGAMTVPSLFVMMALMFIGASPGGTGGGVKTSTFSITLAALWATVRGKNDTVIYKRRLGPELVAKAFFVSLIAFVTRTRWLLLLTEGATSDDTFRNHVSFRHRGALHGRKRRSRQSRGLLLPGRQTPHHADDVRRPPRAAHTRHRRGAPWCGAGEAPVSGRQDSRRVAHMAKRTFAVIGLGRFGAAMATTLSQLGHEVIGIDGDDDRVTSLADQVSQTVKLDATDERALRAAGIQDVDVAVVSIGENIESSLLVVTLVKELGIDNIVARRCATHGHPRSWG